MKERETLYIIDPKKWREWLAKNYDKRREIWLIYYKKHTGKPTIPYNDAVEEALAYGWIDSIVKRIDDEKHMQRFTPRRDNSVWAESNKKRVKKLIKEGRMTQVGLNKYKIGMKLQRKGPKLKDSKGKLIFPRELTEALKKNRQAWKNWKKLPYSTKEMYVHNIISAKREETKKRRVKKAVKAAMEKKRY